MIEVYNDGRKAIREDAQSDDFVKISPSGFHKFFTSRHTWFEENVLRDKRFKGNTSTLLGTIVHHILEKSTNSEMIVDNQEVEDYISIFMHNHPEIEIDKEYILDNYNTLASVIWASNVRDYIFHSKEEFIWEKLQENIYVGGSYDAVVEDPNHAGGYKVVDYKTSTTKPRGFTVAYRLQLYQYAYLLKNKGINVTSIELAYAVLPTKTIGARSFTFTEGFNNANYDYIKKQLELVAETVKFYQENPALRHIVAGSWDFKDKEVDISFNF